MQLTLRLAAKKSKVECQESPKFTNLIGVISGRPLKLHNSNSIQNEKSTGLALYGPARSCGNKPG